MQFWAIIVDSFRESRDRKIFWVMLLMTAIIVLAMASVGFQGDRVTFFFGSLSTETDQFNPLVEMGRTRIVGLVVYLIVTLLFGWAGIILMLVATASFFPHFLERGVIDTVLAKPISRPRLFLYKYFAGMVFVLEQAVFFVGATFLVMGLRWGIWSPGYLLTAPLLVVLFSYIYCVSVWVALKTRSSVAAILIGLAAWAVFAMVHQAPGIFEAFPKLKERRVLYTTVRAVSWIPPKTGDFPYLLSRWTKAGTSVDIFPSEVLDAGSEMDRASLEAARQMEEKEIKKCPMKSIGSSLLFEAVVVAMAMWSFSRRDY